MQIELRTASGKERLHLQMESAVRLPWNTSVVLAFEAFHERLRHTDPADVISAQFHIGLCDGHLSAITKTVPPPSAMAYSADALLENAALKEVGRFYHHPTGWLPRHENLWQVPAGEIGGGMVLVRDITTLAYGRRNSIPREDIERRALGRTHATALLEELGYVRSDHADTGDS